MTALELEPGDSRTCDGCGIVTDAGDAPDWADGRCPDCVELEELEPGASSLADNISPAELVERLGAWIGGAMGWAPLEDVATLVAARRLAARVLELEP